MLTGVFDPAALAVGPNVIVHDLPGGEWRRIRTATGYHAVIVNGEQTIADDQQTNQHSGRLVRHGKGRVEAFARVFRSAGCRT
ncbi:MAG: hypothetical protein ACKVWR_18355 [Acidimicrobiales bacterium]